MKTSRFSSLVAAILVTAIQWASVCSLTVYAQSIEIGSATGGKAQ
jgi:hypothetical protein